MAGTPNDGLNAQSDIEIDLCPLASFFLTCKHLNPLWKLHQQSLEGIAVMEQVRLIRNEKTL